MRSSRGWPRRAWKFVNAQVINQDSPNQSCSMATVCAARSPQYSVSNQFVADVVFTGVSGWLPSTGSPIGMCSRFGAISRSAANAV